MECFKKNKAAEIAIDYCAGTLDDSQKRDFEQHMRDCAECSRAVEAQREVWAMLDRMGAPEVSADFDARLYARIAREDAAPAWRRWMRRLLHPAVPLAVWKPAVSLAAACAVLAAGLLVRPPHAPDHSPQSRIENVDLDQVQTALDDIDVLMPPAPETASGAM